MGCGKGQETGKDTETIPRKYSLKCEAIRRIIKHENDQQCVEQKYKGEENKHHQQGGLKSVTQEKEVN